MSYFAADGILTILVAALGGLVLSIVGYLRGFSHWSVLGGVFFIISLGAGVVVALPVRYFRKKGLYQKINKILEGWHKLVKNKDLVLKLLFLNSVIIFFFGIKYFIIFRIFSVNAPFLLCMIIAPFSLISYITSILPGGYGVREVVVGVVAQFTDVGFTEGVLATIFDRVFVIFMGVIVAPIFVHKVLFLKGGDNEET